MIGVGFGSVGRGANVYFVSSNGNDANLGRVPEKPFLTIAKALTLVREGQTILLDRGSTFNEDVVIPYDNIILGAYGVGDKPFIDCSAVIATPTLVSGNVYQTINTHGTTGTGRPVLFENGIAMIPVANETECENTPGSYVVSSGDSFSFGSFTTKFHYNASNTYTFNKLEGISNAAGASGVKVFGIKAGYQFVEGGSIRLNADSGCYIEDCEAIWGNKHNAFIPANSKAKGIIAYGCEYQGQYSRSATLFVAYTSAGGSTATFEDCAAINRLQKSGQELGASTSAYVAHTSTGQFSKCNLINSYAEGCSTAVGLTADQVDVIGCYFDKITSQIHNTTTSDINFINTFMRALSTADANTNANIDTYFRDCVAILYKTNGGTWTGTFTATNTVFFAFYKTNSGWESLVQLISESAVPEQVTMNYCVVYGYRMSVTAATDKYTGNYNIFYSSNGTQIRNVYNGTHYTTLSSWQSATGQDAQSVYLTDTQAETFFLTDPRSGDTVINPLCKVTAANGTVYTGEFPDGTKIKSVITDKMFAHRKAKYVDLTELE